MNKKTTFLAIGALLVVVGILLMLYERMEISVICPFGGETPSEAAYCLTHEGYYGNLALGGLVTIIFGVAFIALKAASVTT